MRQEESEEQQQKRESAEQKHERESQDRVKCFQSKLTEKTTDDELKLINARLDAQLKIEDFMVKWREANHAWAKVWAPTFISVVVALAGVGAGYQGYTTHKLENRKANAEIALKAAREKQDETRVNLEALRGAGLLDLTPEEINNLSSLRPGAAK
jgi:hypothetical protein